MLYVPADTCQFSRFSWGNVMQAFKSGVFKINFILLKTDHNLFIVPDSTPESLYFVILRDEVTNANNS